MNISGAAQAEIVKVAAIGVAALVVVLMLRRSAQSVGAVWSETVDTVLALPGRAVDAVAETTGAAVSAVFTPRVGTDGWQFFPMDGVAIAPDGSYWMGTKKIWSPES